MTEFTPTLALKVSFTKEAAHFLGQGTYRNGANLSTLEQAIHGSVLKYNWEAGRDIRWTPKTVNDDGSVSVTLTFGDIATPIIQDFSKKSLCAEPRSYLEVRLQEYFDKKSWCFRKGHTITVEQCPLEQKR